MRNNAVTNVSPHDKEDRNRDEKDYRDWVNDKRESGKNTVCSQYGYTD